MSSRSEEELLNDRLEAMGRLERRRLLLRLARTSPDDSPRIDFSELERNADDLDPLVTMRHLHLPILEDRGFIRWNREDYWIAKGPRFDELEPLLELFREIRHEHPDRGV